MKDGENKEEKSILSLLCHNWFHLFSLITLNDSLNFTEYLFIQPQVKNCKNTKQTLRVMTVQDKSFNTLYKIVLILLSLKTA